MARFRKKPVVIEAVHWMGDWRIVMEWLDRLNGGRYVLPVGSRPPIVRVGDSLEIETLEGTMRADKGDWVIRGVSGEFYPCKPDIFGQTYEAVE